MQFYDWKTGYNFQQRTLSLFSSLSSSLSLSSLSSSYVRPSFILHILTGRLQTPRRPSQARWTARRASSRWPSTRPAPVSLPARPTRASRSTRRTRTPYALFLFLFSSSLFSSSSHFEFYLFIVCSVLILTLQTPETHPIVNWRPSRIKKRY